MKDKDIIAELDALKLRIMIEGVEHEPTDLEKYDKWLDEIMGRKIKSRDWKVWDIFHPREYAECKTIATLVQDLFHKKHSHKLWFQKDKPEIKKIIQEVVFMAMFVNKEFKE